MPDHRRSNAAAARGGLVARALTGAWRSQEPPPSLSPTELVEIAPILLRTGEAGLLWWRIRSTELAETPAALELREVYRHFALQAAVQDRHLVQTVALLRSAGVEPLLVKGWSVARLYPAPGMRPYGDLDLCVRPDQYARARAALRGPEGPRVAADLHDDFSRKHFGHSLLDDRHMDELYERSHLVRLGETDVRIMAPEDHLRLLCLHLLAHGGWRPLWLCDIAAALESRPTRFDWECCLGGNARRTDWVACTLGLAHRLLGASLENTPIAGRARSLPSWLVSTVLRQWGEGQTMRGQMISTLRHPLAALAELPRHWPNPIEATIRMGGPFSRSPRFPFQFGAAVTRTAQFLGELLYQRREFS
jgi:hypothetical protein